MFLSPQFKLRAALGLLLTAALLPQAGLVGAASAQPNLEGAFINYENPPVHPLDISPDGSTMALANIPNNRVDFYDLTPGVPVPTGSVDTGLDPVTVRFRTNGELWAVATVSDSVSVIDVASRRVVRTIHTLDEPMDVVFAGSPERAFVSCSQVNTIVVLDPATGAQTGTVAIKAEDPRALAVSPDKTKVYAAVYESGNRTTILAGGADGNTIGEPPNIVGDPLGPYGGVNPPPNGPGGTFVPPLNPGNPAAPKVGLIIKQREGDNKWVDDNGTDWSLFVDGAMADKSGRIPGWTLLDHDVAIIDANTLALSYVDGLMNLCMGISVNPATGKIYVIGTDATNEVRFEPNVKGKFLRVDCAIIDPAGPTREAVVDLNPHLDYSTAQIPQPERDKSIGDPRGIAWSPDGTRGYVTGMGSNNLIVIDQAGNRIGAIPINVGEGPVGIAVDAARGQVYVQNRFKGTISVLHSGDLAQTAEVVYYDPSPAAIKIGRKHLYDTHKNSGLGQISCASCHIDGKMDKLSWDLGDPSGAMKAVNEIAQNSPQTGSAASAHNNLGGIGTLLANLEDFHPMKGPMTTQTFQDIVGNEPFHWRGDREGLEEFNGAFIGLQGDDTNLTPQEMQEFENMVASLVYPPNPYRNFDNTLPQDLDTKDFAAGKFALPDGAPLPVGHPNAGLDLYRTADLDGRGAIGSGINCVTCHSLPTGMGADKVAGNLSFSFVGGGLRATANFLPINQGPNGEHHLFMTSLDGSTNKAIKVAQLRNQFEKTGFHLTQPESTAGFGVVHDGSVDGVGRFVTEPIFFPSSDQDVADLAAFNLCFSGGDLPQGGNSGSIDATFNLTVTSIDIEVLGPPGRDSHAGVGRNFTISSPADIPTIQGQNGLAIMRAEANENGNNGTRGIDLVVKQKVGGKIRGYFYDRASQTYIPDDDAGIAIIAEAMPTLASPGSELTFMAVQRGSGRRVGIDEDGDGYGDETERLACTDPANPASHPDLGAPDATVTGDPLTFGGRDIAAGPSGVITITVGNAGPGDLFFKGPQIAIAGPNAADFHIVNSPAVTPLTTAQSRTIDVVFDPSSAGIKSANLVISTSDCDQANVVLTLSGTGTTAGSGGRVVGDFNDSGCTDITDFLFLLDYWQNVSPIGGDPIGINDFLALLDNWQTGGSC